jgi:hypothetical protein
MAGPRVGAGHRVRASGEPDGLMARTARIHASPGRAIAARCGNAKWGVIAAAT